MIKRNYFITLILVYFITAVSAAYAIPKDTFDAVMDIKLPITSFWQGGDSEMPNVKGWGCDYYASYGKGVWEKCKNPTANWDGPTVGAKGCAITSVTMLAWYYGMDYSLPSGRVDPGTLDDWLVDHNGYNELNDVIWWTPAGELSYPLDWLKITPTGGFFSTTVYKFMVPNYCCDDNCSHKAYDCFTIAATSTDITELVNKEALL